MSDRNRKPHRPLRNDWDDSEIPELTDEDFAQMRPAREVFPDIDDFPKPKPRGPQKAPTKVQATFRIDSDVIEYLRGTGRGWQTRVNETLRREVEREKKRAKS